MKKNQLAKLGLTLGLVAAVGVGGTMALLSAQSNTVTNTFTVGKGLHSTDIKLDEAKVDPETGKKVEPEERVSSNEYKNIEQRSVLDKDPTVTIKSTAADCYVFVQIEGLKDSEYYDVTIDENWMATTKDNVYVYTTDKQKAAVVSGGLSGDAGLVFNGVKIKDDAPLFEQKGDEWVAKTNLPKIVVKACAVQENEVSYDDALNAVTFAK